mgnify:CR=1 FL=1|tara:strand:- start:55362 stop:56312 length:951 start_codon:yes stop_codon:yes gene_type:complete
MRPQVLSFSILFTGMFAMTGQLAVAEPFNSFLNSLDQRLPMNTMFMQHVLLEHKTKLALPSLLEKWGVINQDAAATYNGVLNTVVLKEEHTTDEIRTDGKTRKRIKTINELEFAEPSIWSVQASTIFHELSHAEYAWLPKSKDPVDITLLAMLGTDLDQYLKTNYSKLSVFDRRIARSEMFAYFRGDFLLSLVNAVEEIMMENGYYKTSKTCRVSNFFLTQRGKHPELDYSKFVAFGDDVSLKPASLPFIYVKGKDIEINSKHPLNQKLGNALWNQIIFHFSPAKSKFEVIRWMNSKPEFLKLIESCRAQLPALPN